jgi:uridine kinase
MSFVIGISGLRGAGKTTLVDEVARRLGAAKLLFDDYAYLPPSSPPDDLAEWIAEGADLRTWAVPALTEDLLALKAGRTLRNRKTGVSIDPSAVIVVEEPFGRLRESLRDMIDFAVLIDTPHDIALARSLLRELVSEGAEVDANKFRLMHIKWLKGYLRAHETLCLLQEKLKAHADLILDGARPSEQLVRQLMVAVSSVLSEAAIQKVGL